MPTLVQDTGRDITKRKRVPPIAAAILPPGGVTKAFSRLFQYTFLNLSYKDLYIGSQKHKNVLKIKLFFTF